MQLLDPLGNVLGSTDTYGTAKDGQSWALAKGKWYWTTTPTPNAPNVVNQPLASVKKVSTATASNKKSAVKGTATKVTKSKAAPTTAASVVPSDPPITPVHPGILAAAAAFALLYGAYEYRHDVANKLYQLRRYRAARAEARASLERR